MMAGNHEAMSDEDMIRMRMLVQYHDAIAGKRIMSVSAPTHLGIVDDIVSQALGSLLAEVERLRAENAAMRPIVEAVERFDEQRMPIEWDGSCLCCGAEWDQDHTEACAITQARAFVAAHPAPPA